MLIITGEPKDYYHVDGDSIIIDLQPIIDGITKSINNEMDRRSVDDYILICKNFFSSEPESVQKAVEEKLMQVSNDFAHEAESATKLTSLTEIPKTWKEWFLVVGFAFLFCVAFVVLSVIALPFIDHP
ncbi:MULTISPECIES: hypothetical protein [Xenorhabdus]|uniref:Uncharacterized protein n=1 Tax=Xenorhabdus ishibashii TaxID=1034471 RepID=A0A2D0KEE8_9GAMM|nr:MULTISPECIES: hypothetical protein [Xenorhabdus]PHM61809.1 hypothetical protein Xish_00957 [Xenorhabdus ishibashii]